VNITKAVGIALPTSLIRYKRKLTHPPISLQAGGLGGGITVLLVFAGLINI